MLSNKKKNGRVFLISSIVSIAVLTSLVTLVTDSTPELKNEQSDTDAIPSVSVQTTAIDLPEIGYNSEVLSKGIVYSESVYAEPETVLQIPAVNLETAQNNNLINNEPTPKATVILASVNEDITQNDQTKPEPVSPVVELEVEPEVEQKSAITASVITELAQKTQQANTSKPALNEAPTKKVESSTALIEKETNKKSAKTINVVVKKGDTLSVIFKRLSLSNTTLYQIINSGKQAKRLTRIKPGQKFTIGLNRNNEVESLQFALNQVDTLIVEKQSAAGKTKKFISRIDSKEIDVQQQFASGTINNSLFSSASKAGLSSSMTMKLAHIFGWDIDFALDIRKGDTFSILFEENYIDGKKVSDGNILSVEFVNQGKTFKAVRYTDASGHTDYYSEKGLSMRKAFLRTPVEFSRISSRFSSGRKHPVLNKIRAHKGVDYAASRGTPIKSVGNGKVIFKGRKGGYGRVIILQHGSKYTTLYAHMNSYNKKIRKGSRVKQGQTIGYIGSSGLATGPHLHYEFRLNGVHRNPLTVPLPSAAPIAKKYRKDFQIASDTLISQLKLRKLETVALKDE